MGGVGGLGIMDGRSFDSLPGYRQITGYQKGQCGAGPTTAVMQVELDACSYSQSLRLDVLS